MSENEFSIIEQYLKPLSRSSKGVVLGSGDDCAVLDVQPGLELCISTDTLLAGVHFPKDASASLIASRATGVCVSDLAAMGARPLGMLLALVVPDAVHEWFAELSSQLKARLDDLDMSLVGGNLARSKQDEISVTLTVFGEVPGAAAITRSGAKPGDEVFVSGCIGDGTFGLEVWLEGKQGSKKLARLAEKYASPEPRIATGMALRGLATAMIDVSDGLLADASHLATAGDCCLELQLESVPFSKEAQSLKTFDPLRAVTGGDDYELCFTAPSGAGDQLEAIAQQTGIPLTRIGRVVEGCGLLLTREGETIDAINVPSAEMDQVPQGYDHFSDHVTSRSTKTGYD